MVVTTLLLDTILGQLLVSARCQASAPGRVDVRLDAVVVWSPLPLGMSVLRRSAVVLRLTAADDVPVLFWTCTLDGKAIGSPNNGEGLAAQEWKGDNGLVTVGTEDRDYLATRLMFLSRQGEPGFMTYSPRSIQVRVPSVPQSTRVSMHDVIAENRSPEPVEASSWFAVDVPHAELASR